jgi:hypothetical protein
VRVSNDHGNAYGDGRELEETSWAICGGDGEVQVECMASLSVWGLITWREFVWAAAAQLNFVWAANPHPNLYGL